MFCFCVVVVDGFVGFRFWCGWSSWGLSGLLASGLCLSVVCFAHVCLCFLALWCRCVDVLCCFAFFLMGFSCLGRGFPGVACGVFFGFVLFSFFFTVCCGFGI